MDTRLPPDQEAHLTALAASSGRSADEVMREALILWEQRQAARSDKTKHTPTEAATRILELRDGNRLPEGETIKGLIEHGRA